MIELRQWYKTRETVFGSTTGGTVEIAAGQSKKLIAVHAIVITPLANSTVSFLDGDDQQQTAEFFLLARTPLVLPISELPWFQTNVQGAELRLDANGTVSWHGIISRPDA